VNDYAVHPILAAIGSGSIDGLDHVRYLLRLKAAGRITPADVTTTRAQEQIVRPAGPASADSAWSDGQHGHQHGRVST
jgi:hypothetical protein